MKINWIFKLRTYFHLLKGYRIWFPGVQFHVKMVSEDRDQQTSAVTPTDTILFTNKKRV